MFFTGYLKKVCERKDERTIYLTFSIPNEEILSLYENTIREWFEKKVKQSDFMPFYEALMCEKCEKIENFINSQLAGSISYYDNEENFYHGYMLGILSGLSGYEIRSNREYGEGRPDIMLRPFSPKQPAIIFEFKRADKFAQMEEKCNEALRQIEEKKYDAELIDFGYQKILKYGICFCRKNCMVKTGSS